MSYPFNLAQLRHAYTQLHENKVPKQEAFANGLISPIIMSMERNNRKVEKFLLDIISNENIPVDIKTETFEILSLYRE